MPDKLPVILWPELAPHVTPHCMVRENGVAKESRFNYEVELNRPDGFPCSKATH